jgi:hypothetical protein
MRIFRFLLPVSAMLLGTAAALPSQSSQDDALRQLAAQDLVLAQVGLRLATANVALCDEQMPGTGLVLHALAQYPQAMHPAAQRVFGFESPLAIAAIVPASPAAAAGLNPGEGIVTLAGLAVPQEQATDAPASSALRDRFENALIALPAHAALALETTTHEKPRAVTIQPVPACRARFEVITGNSWLARSDGTIIQVSSRFLAQFSADEVAVVVAHELAHGILRHRRRLAAAGVSKGLFAEMGRSGRLNRRVEAEADRLSVHLLRNAGYPADLAPRFWRMRGKEMSWGLVRSRNYASPEDRARAMEAEIAALPANPPAVHAPPLLATRDQPLL